MRTRFKPRAWGVALWSVLALAQLCAGQAWVPERGEGEFSVIYQNVYTGDHYFADGQRVNLGRSRVVGLIESVDFGLTDRLAISAALPIMAGKYSGSFPHLLPIDNGNYHGGAGDFHLTARYALRERPLSVTPFVSISLPPVGYQYFAQSAIGTNMWEFALGVNAGRRLDPWLPKAYFQARYAYAITQNVSMPSYHLDVRPNRSRFDADLGYSLSRRIVVRGLVSSQIVQGGFSDTSIPPSTPGDELWHHHDQITALNYVSAGAGVTLSLTKSVDTFATFQRSVWLRNGPALDAGITVGMSWSFRAPWARKPMMFGAAPAASNWRAKLNEVKLCH